MSYDRQQLQFAVALRAGTGGHHQQGLRLVVGEHDLAVDLCAAQLGVNESLAVLEARGDFVPFPDAAVSILENVPEEVATAMVAELREAGASAHAEANQ